MIKSTMMVVVAIAVATGSTQAQDCYSCDQGVNRSFGFGYPSAGGARLGSGHHGHLANWRERKEAWHEEAAKIKARNDAWPKPFACQDRQAYFAFWAPMIHQGYASHCVLAADHFDAETHQLNRAGQNKVASIMQNLPVDRRHLLVSRDQDPSISEARLASVNETVSTWYGQSAPHATIGLTDLAIPMISGIQAQDIAQKRTQGNPAPIIPASTIGQSIQSSTGR